MMSIHMAVQYSAPPYILTSIPHTASKKPAAPHSGPSDKRKAPPWAFFVCEWVRYVKRKPRGPGTRGCLLLSLPILGLFAVTLTWFLFEPLTFGDRNKTNTYE
jgi:hypothetical protein